MQNAVQWELFVNKSRPETQLITSLPEFCLASLRQMRAPLLKNTLNRLASGNVGEKMWQSEFYAASTTFLAQEIFVSSEVGTDDRKGIIDFIIHDGFKWGVEFLVGGKNLGEHLHRFHSSGGIYSTLDLDAYLVVDFRPKPPYQTIEELSNVIASQQTWPGENFWVVFYEPDFSLMTVFCEPNKRPLFLALQQTQPEQTEDP